MMMSWARGGGEKGRILNGAVISKEYISGIHRMDGKTTQLRKMYGEGGGPTVEK